MMLHELATKRRTEVVKVLCEAQRSYVITDPRQVDNPIVWVSPSFCELTGYSSSATALEGDTFDKCGCHSSSTTRAG